ncbi:Oxysterol-binding protein-related protein 1C [Asimina triloba]
MLMIRQSTDGFPHVHKRGGPLSSPVQIKIPADFCALPPNTLQTAIASDVAPRLIFRCPRGDWNSMILNPPSNVPWSGDSLADCMHPFCCVSAEPERNGSPARVSELPRHMPPSFARSDAIASSVSARRCGAFPQSLDSSNGHGRPRPAEGRPELPDQRDVKLNDVAGNGISGILCKWVNYGRGWRPRWFVLQDGVLSYYKIHGPDKIEVNQETEKGSRVIGEESFKRINLRRAGASPLRRRPVGEVHLKVGFLSVIENRIPAVSDLDFVSSIRESRSDDKRFSIFTGTKRLHLRAETREDRIAWMDALQKVKDMFPRMSNSELMAPVDNFVVSTEKLRQRLTEEGVTEAAILDSEQIMKSEFTALQNKLVLLKQKYLLLIDTLRQLETEKVDLENTVVDESQRQSKEHVAATRLKNDKSSEGSATESDDEIERNEAAEEETDDDDNAFFDTRDFLSSSSFRSSESDYRRSSFDSDEENLSFYAEEGVDDSIKSAGFSYPYISRRKKLPDPREKEKGVSLWSMIKDNIGKDLTKVCLPVYFNEPLSTLQKCFEEMEYSFLIDRANEWGKSGNSLMRMLNVAAFAVSGYACTEGRSCKPFNPLLGETYEADYPDKGLRFFSEKAEKRIREQEQENGGPYGPFGKREGASNRCGRGALALIGVLIYNWQDVSVELANRIFFDSLK